VSDIDTGVVDSLKVLDPDGRLEKRPVRITRSSTLQAVVRLVRLSAAMILSMSTSTTGSEMPARFSEPLIAAACEEK
jgi:hypothetical protein